MNRTGKIEDLARSLGGSAQTVAARRGVAILYYSAPGDGSDSWDELHIRLEKPATIVIAVLPDSSHTAEREKDHVPDRED